MEPRQRRTRLRAILDGSACVSCPSVFDPASARIAEEVGFEVGILGGSIVSMLKLGAPDVNVLTLTELADQARCISRAIEIPLIVDADSGYGNALNVMRTIEELEWVGTAGVTIEDSNIPRPAGKEPPPLIPIDEASRKIKAALAARRDASFAIIARTSASGCNSQDELLARVAAYEAAGADCLCLTGVETHSTLDAIVSVTALPILLIAYGNADVGDFSYLGSRNVKLYLDGHRAFEASVRAIYDSLTKLRDGSPQDLTQQTSQDLLGRVTRSNVFKKNILDYVAH